jgi:hypothetical protein
MQGITDDRAIWLTVACIANELWLPDTDARMPWNGCAKIVIVGRIFPPFVANLRCSTREANISSSVSR